MGLVCSSQSYFKHWWGEGEIKEKGKIRGKSKKGKHFHSGYNENEK